MIQVIMKNGVLLRFTEKIVGIDINDIEYQKELTKEEELLRPIKINNEIKYIDNNDLVRYNWIKGKND